MNQICKRIFIAVKVSPKIVTCFFYLTLFSNLLGSSIWERYRGSSQEKATDKQIKEYQPSAIKNRQTFGRAYGLNQYMLLKKSQELVMKWIQEKPEEFGKLCKKMVKPKIYQKNRAAK